MYMQSEVPARLGQKNAGMSEQHSSTQMAYVEIQTNQMELLWQFLEHQLDQPEFGGTPF